jgi:hypothetical protein
MSTLSIMPSLGIALEGTNTFKATALSLGSSSTSIHWKTGLLQQIRAYVNESYISRSGKGDDRGGVLFGYFEAGEIEVLAWSPIERSSSGTSHFYLDAQDRKALRKMLESYTQDATLRSLEVVGWFRSRTIGQPNLEEHDQQFHEDFFTNPSQFALIVRPSHQRPAAACLYLKDEKKEFQRVAQLAIAAEAPATTAELAPTVPEPVRSFSLLRFLAVLATLALLCAAGLGALQWHERSVEAAAHPILNFQVTLAGNELHATWDNTLPVVHNADSAQLLLGGERLQISHAELVQGFLKLPLPASLESDLEITLKVGKTEELAQLVLPAQN